MHIRKVTVILVYLVTIVISLVIADPEANKRMSGSSHAFQQMVRYGRSSKKDPKINVYPRADVFYLGPRYGKRALTTPTWDSLGNLDEITDTTFPCTYTGISNLYRCNTSRSTLRQRRK